MKADLIADPRQAIAHRAPPRLAPARRLLALIQSRPAAVKAVLSVLDQVIFSGAAFATAVIVGRACSEEQLGLYYLTRTIVLVLFGIEANLIIRPFTIFSARFRGRELAEYTGSIWAHHLALTGIGMLAILLILGGSTLGGSSSFMPGLLALLVAAPVLMLREVIRGLAFVRMQPLLAIALDVTVLVLQIAGLLAMWYFDRVSIPVVFGVMGGACAVACIGWLAFSSGRPRFAKQRFWQDCRTNWAFAKWVSLSWLTVDTIPFMMPWIIGWSANISATGRFGACATLVGVANILVVGTGNYVYPKAAQAFATSGVVAMRQLLSATAWMFTAVFGAFCLAMLFFGDWVAMLTYGPSFAGTGFIVAALAANVLVGSLGFVAQTGLLAIGQPRMSLIADVCMLATTMASAMLLVLPYGALGAALATLIGVVIGTAIKGGTLLWLMRSLEQSGGMIPASADEGPATETLFAHVVPAKT